ncbi:hypothetical protein ACWF7H_26150 [Peribacillus butanolivorans]|uniref:hypothetical protein n=1 Tax=Peribacillus butanolivorans TaxID=421767 RepID=UPI003683A6E4
MRQNSELVLTKEDILRMVVKHLDVFPLTSLEAIREVIRSSLKQQGLIFGVTEHSGGGTITNRDRISDEDTLLINDCIYDLLYTRVITPGINDDNLDLPWIHVSDKEKLKTYLNKS